MNDNKGNELMLEFELRKPFPQLPYLVDIANDILQESNSTSMLDMKEGKILGIHIYRCRRSFASLSIMAMVKKVSKDMLFAISKYNYAETFNCSSRIELEENSELYHGPNLRIILQLPNNYGNREKIEKQFSLLDFNS